MATDNKQSTTAAVCADCKGGKLHNFMNIDLCLTADLACCLYLCALLLAVCSVSCKISSRKTDDTATIVDMWF